MADPTSAEYTTLIKSVSDQVFTPKDLRCLRIYGLAGAAATSPVNAVADYKTNLSGSATSLVNVAMGVLGKVPTARMQVALTMSILTRGGAMSSTTSASTIMALIRKLRECNDHELAAAENYITGLFLEAAGLPATA